MIDFYGAPASSAGRTHLMLEECGIAYQYHHVNLRDETNKAEFLSINPGGRVPFLIDGEVRMQESIAINFYLAEKYAPALWATSIEHRALIYQWSLWSITNLQAETMRVAHHTMLVPVEQRSTYEAQTGRTNTQTLLDELERALVAPYLVDHRFTVADLNVASVVNLAAAFQAGTLGARTKEWLASIKARAAWNKVAAGG
jgi:glutathione S-transferase